MAEEQLERKAGLGTVLALSIGSIVGTGLFFGASIGAFQSGNLVIVAWIILSLISLYIAMCFSELVSMYPKSGGVYEFSKQAYGRSISFIVGWVTWLVGNITAVVLIVAATNSILPEDSLVNLGFSYFTWEVSLGLLIGAALLIGLNVIALIGIEASAIVLILFALISLSVIISIIVKGIGFIDVSNYTPLFTHEPITILITIFFIAETYFGWESATFLAEETKNPTKTIPRALLISTILVALLGLSLVFVQLGIFGYERLGAICGDGSKSCAPISEIALLLFGARGQAIINWGIFLTLIGSAAGAVVTMPRLVLALARDKLFMGQFKKIHPVFKTPYKAIIFQTIVLLAILVIGFANYLTILQILVPLAIVMYVFTLLTIPILRFKHPDLERPFKVPFGKIGPILLTIFFGIIIALWAVSVEGAISLLALSASFVLVGLPLYLLVAVYYDPKAITSVNDIFNYANVLGEWYVLPSWVRKTAMGYLGDIKGKTVFEYGCSVGTMTLPLIKAVGPTGTVYATHFSKSGLKITRKRVDNLDWDSDTRQLGTLISFHDENHMERIQQEIDYADAIVSVGMLSYIQDIRRVLREINDILPDGAPIVFVEYVDYFHILPNKEWLDNNKNIEKIFRDAGFSVRVSRKKGLLWNYLFVYGIKWKEQVAFI